MFKDDVTRIKHIIDASKECISFIEGKSSKDLDANRMLNLSIERLIEIIVEDARGVSEQFRKKYPDIPW